MTLPHPEDESLLPVFRALMECHTVVSRVTGRHIEALGLTPSQFDVLAVLGDTDGMTCSELGRRTLISKGTLTPVLDRMEAKGWIVRQRGEQDARQVQVSLTARGEREFERCFMPHVAFVKSHLDEMPEERQGLLIGLLDELKSRFQLKPKNEN
ncbi:MAG: MarR family transcriptional regulator [Candidatus Sericytochromatia bacterium]|nr:MarR family transcriptional regulator [Candidatus Sericytochromatia bacterium]